MQTTYEKLSSNKVKLTFVVEPEKFEEGINKSENDLFIFFILSFINL